MATQIGPIDVQLFQSHLLPLQIRADPFGDTGFRGIGGGHAYSSDETGVQIMQHMAFVAIHPHATTFASVAHLPVFHADAPLFGDPLDQADLPLLIDLYVLRLDCLAIARAGCASCASSCFRVCTQLSPTCNTSRTS